MPDQPVVVTLKKLLEVLATAPPGTHQERVKAEATRSVVFLLQKRHVNVVQEIPGHESDGEGWRQLELDAEGQPIPERYAEGAEYLTDDDLVDRFSEFVVVSWITERVFVDREEAKAYANQHKHNYKACQVYGVPAEGFLASILKLVDELKPALEQIDQERQFIACAFCGHKSPVNDLKALQDHMIACDKHPIGLVARALSGVSMVLSDMGIPKADPEGKELPTWRRMVLLKQHSEWHKAQHDAMRDRLLELEELCDDVDPLRWKSCGEPIALRDDSLAQAVSLSPLDKFIGAIGVSFWEFLDTSPSNDQIFEAMKAMRDIFDNANRIMDAETKQAA